MIRFLFLGGGEYLKYFFYRTYELQQNTRKKYENHVATLKKFVIKNDVFEGQGYMKIRFSKSFLQNGQSMRILKIKFALLLNKYFSTTLQSSSTIMSSKTSQTLPVNSFLYVISSYQA